MRRHLHLGPGQVVLVQLTEPLPSLETPFGIELERLVHERLVPSSLPLQNGVAEARVERLQPLQHFSVWANLATVRDLEQADHVPHPVTSPKIF